MGDSADFTEELEDFRRGGDAVTMPEALDIGEEFIQDYFPTLRQAIIESGYGFRLHPSIGSGDV